MEHSAARGDEGTLRVNGTGTLRASEVVTLRVNGIVEESVVDGPGLRFVVFTQGCLHGCKGCHNPDTHSLEGGYLVDIAALVGKVAENPLLAGITLSGGEPFLQAAALSVLAAQVRAMGKHVLVYTGYVYEDLVQKGVHDSHIKALLELTDTLIDGPYMEEYRNLTLLHRGSENQRILPLHAGLCVSPSPAEAVGSGSR